MTDALRLLKLIASLEKILQPCQANFHVFFNIVSLLFAITYIEEWGP